MDGGRFLRISDCLHPVRVIPKVKRTIIRSDSELDEDRVLYCDAFRRLAGVAQVITPDDLQFFHTRLTHSLEVAQIGRRIAQRLLKKYKTSFPNIELFLDPNIVSAAAMIHDIGHPPFGHVAEEELDYRIREIINSEGFNGNAQSFRIINKVAIHRTSKNAFGLNLTLATLNAVLKYPWLSTDKRAVEKRKYGSYLSEEKEFTKAREILKDRNRMSLEAEIMDYADDIAYSIHDIADFQQVDLIPLERLVGNNYEYKEFIRAWLDDPRAEVPNEKWRKLMVKESSFRDNYDGLFKNLIGMFALGGGGKTKGERLSILTRSSVLINKYVSEAEIIFDDSIPKLKRPKHVDEWHVQMLLMKRLVAYYLVKHPRLKTIQLGHKVIIGKLFETYYDAVVNKLKRKNKINENLENIIPIRFIESAKSVKNKYDCVRLAADIICCLTDKAAYNMYCRITGSRLHEITDVAFW